MPYRAADLIYRLLDGPARLEPLRVLETRALAWRGWRVTFCALGASHAVCLEREGAQVTELLTCAPPAGAFQPLVESAALSEQSLCVTAHGLDCRVCLIPFDLAEGETLQGAYDPVRRL